MNVVIFSILLIYSLTIAGDKIFRLSHDNYKPFHWFDKDSVKTKGIFIDMVDELIGKRMGYKVIYKEYPWKRAQKTVEDGINDAFITTPTPERLKYTVVGKNPFIKMKKVIFTQPDNSKLEAIKEVRELCDLRQIDDLKIVDYLGNGWCKKNIEEDLGIVRIKSASFDSVLRMLSAKRGDIFIEEPVIVNYYIKENRLESRIIQLPVVLGVADFKLCIGVNSAFKGKTEKFDKHLKDMQEDGTMGKILKKWGVI